MSPAKLTEQIRSDHCADELRKLDASFGAELKNVFLRAGTFLMSKHLVNL